MSGKPTCGSCQNEVEPTWRYCRYCGAAQNRIRKPQVEIEHEVTREVKEKVVFNKSLYKEVLSTRSERTELIKEKQKLKDDIASLLEQLESKVITREYALPQIKELKSEVDDVSKREEKFKDLPSQLPVEVLLDQMDDAEDRLDKIDDLKNDPAVTKEAIREAKKRAEEAILILREEYSVVAGHLRTWHSEVSNQLDEERKNLEQLYIRMKTGELTEESYKEKKVAKVAEVSKLSNIVDMLQTMIE